ncbi:MAG: recombinase A [Myxococcales bacterium]|nr:recombinase A [Myxococcales bacterium]
MTMTAPLLLLPTGRATPAPPAEWLSFADLTGRLVEVQGIGAAGRTSWVAGLVARVQRLGEHAAWVQVRAGSLYPPDLAAAGIDLARLPVVRVPGAVDLLRAADVLLRSGGFGLCVVDFTQAGVSAQGSVRAPDPAARRSPAAALGRLLGLCQKHGAALVLLRGEPEPEGAGLGSLVSLRLEVKRARPAGALAALRVEVRKDKRRGPGRTVEERWLGPIGLR